MKLPTIGDKFRTKSTLDSDADLGVCIDTKHIDARRPDQNVTYIGWVPGHGGDVWWMKHENGDVAAYVFNELEKHTYEQDVKDAVNDMVNKVYGRRKMKLTYEQIVRNAIENLSLYMCKRCHNLAQHGWVCVDCGHDPSDDA